MIVRGVERRDIFHDPRDRIELLRWLGEAFPDAGVECWAWALMPNHFHLLVRSPAPALGRAMHRAGSAYAGYFNRRYGRTGHLFQNRYKARPAVDDADVLVLIRYVHRNPLAGGVVRSLLALERHPWCGHGALLGRRPAEPFHAVEPGLCLFADDPELARERLRDFMRSDPGEPSEPTPPETLRDRPVEWARLLALCESVCRLHGVERLELQQGSRARAVSAARATIAERALHELGLKASDVARLLGASPSAILRAARRGEAAVHPPPHPGESSVWGQSPSSSPSLASRTGRG